VSARGAISGATKLYGVAGDPVEHSLSPALHGAAFAALGIDAVSVGLRADADGARSLVDALRHLGVRGVSVTMPLKGLVASHCDEVSDTVARIGSANCLLRLRDGRVRAESTDGAGLVAAIACVAGVDVTGQRCAVLGAGGAARAAIDALAGAGAVDIVVVARRHEAAEEAARVAPVARAGSPLDAAEATVIVQATPVGMLGAPAERDRELLDAAALGAGQVAVELVYHPRVTPWLTRAASAGAAPVEGIEVLIHQAAHALELWLDAEVPLAALHEAVGAP